MTNGYLLVVDENVGIRRLLYDLLTEEGYTVETAVDGKECLAKVRVSEPDLVILDVSSSSMIELEDLIELKRVNHVLPIIMMTSAYREIPSAIFALANELGESSYLNKPFEVDKVLDLVKTLLKK